MNGGERARKREKCRKGIRFINIWTSNGFSFCPVWELSLEPVLPRNLLESRYSKLETRWQNTV